MLNNKRKCVIHEITIIKVFLQIGYVIRLTMTFCKWLMEKPDLLAANIKL